MRRTHCCTKFDFLVDTTDYYRHTLVKPQFDGSSAPLHYRPFSVLTDLRHHTGVVP